MPSMREIIWIDSDLATWQTKGIWRHSSCVCADVRALIGVLNRGKVSPKIPDSLGNVKPVVEIFKNSSPKQVLDSMLFLYFNSFFNFLSFSQDFLLTFVALIGVLNREKVSPKIPDSLGNVKHARNHPNRLRLGHLADQRRLKAFFSCVLTYAH